MAKIEKNVNERKSCFIITPIGNEGSDIRKKAEGVIFATIEPVLKEMNYDMILPQQMSNPGSITNQVIEHIINDELVIANLTGLNANVMYELAIRHAKRKPVVCIIEKSTQLPFDIAADRAIFYDDSMSSVISTKEALVKAIKSVLDGTQVDNPIYRAIKEKTIMDNIKGDENTQDGEALQLIFNKLTTIEKSVGFRSAYQPTIGFEFTTESYAAINFGKTILTKKMQDEICNGIINNYVKRNIIIALSYDNSSNILYVYNANRDENLISTIVNEIRQTYNLPDMRYELIPF